MTIKPKYRVERHDGPVAEIEGRPVQVRDDWEAAAQDAVDLNVGHWDNVHEFRIGWPYVIRAVKS